MSKILGYENEIKRFDIINVQMNLLNRCTSRCMSCRKYTWPNDTLSLEDVENTIYALKKLGLKTILFSGGDPILYKDFGKVIDLCENLGLKYSMISTMITVDDDLLKKIAKTAYRVHVSIDSVDNEMYEKIRGVNGFSYADRSVKIITENRGQGLLPVRISSTVGKLNYKTMFDIYEYAKNNGCLINFYFMHTWDDLKMNEEEVKEFYEILERIAEDEKKNGKRISNAVGLLIDRYDFANDKIKCNKCYLPFVNATVNANGDIYPCCRLLDDNGDYGHQLRYVYGNVKGKSVECIIEEFAKRFDCEYPKSGTLCDECGQRYFGLMSEIESVVTNKKEPLFF